MGKRGKRRRSRPRSEAAATNNTKDSGVTVTSEEPVPEAWKSSVFHDDEVAPILKQCWQAVEKRKRHPLTPTPIQLHAWPILIAENHANVVGIAPTGSGKTLCYGLPLVIAKGKNAVVLVPTRELARQVHEELSPFSKRVICIYGGVDREPQVAALKTDRDWIVVATPGRLVDILESGTGVVVHSLVFDEADHIASNVDMAGQVDTILKILQRQHKPPVGLFSATFPQHVQEKWNEWVGQPQVLIKVNTMTVGEARSPEETSEKQQEEKEVDEIANLTTTAKRPAMDMARIPANVTQILHVCAAHKKPRKLITTLNKIRQEEVKSGRERQKGLCLIFFARIKTLQYVRKLLNQEGFKSAELHSQLQQSQRESTLAAFKSGKMPTLLATDIAARGIHVNNIEYVINYDFPGSLDQYVHRCGRAGRSVESTATVYSFFIRELAPMAKDVVTLLQSSNSWIDPNLSELVGTNNSGGKKKRRRQERPGSDKAQADDAKDAKDDPDWDDDGQFANLCPNRILLKRASHVSDASDSESDEDSS